MTARRKKHCPVCLQLVDMTSLGSIAGHLDNIDIPCLGSGEPYRITLSWKHNYVQKGRVAA